MLILCWQCSNITRFCVKHIKTLGKQETFTIILSYGGIRGGWHKNLVILEHCQHIMSTHWSDIPSKNAGAPEFWCPGTRSLVPFQADQPVFVLISRMGFRNMSFSSLPSVFMCFTRNLVILEHCQHEMGMHWWENTPKEVGGTSVLVPGRQKSGALLSWPTGFQF